MLDPSQLLPVAVALLLLFQTQLRGNNPEPESAAADGQQQQPVRPSSATRLTYCGATLEKKPGYDAGAPHRVRGLLSPAEAAHIVEIATPLLAESMVSTSDSNWRISQTARLPHVPDAVLARLDARLTALMGIPPDRSEGFHVTRYRVGSDLYRLHTDVDPSTVGVSGRVATALVYLSDLSEPGNHYGGETIFTGDPENSRADLSEERFQGLCSQTRPLGPADYGGPQPLGPPWPAAVRPRTGEAVLWRSRPSRWDRAGGGAGAGFWHVNTTHGSCRVLGSSPKWVLQRWFTLQSESPHRHPALLSHVLLGVHPGSEALAELAPYRYDAQLLAVDRRAQAPSQLTRVPGVVSGAQGLRLSACTSVQLGRVGKAYAAKPDCEVSSDADGAAAVDPDGITVAAWFRITADTSPGVLMTVEDGGVHTQLSIDATGWLQWSDRNQPDHPVIWRGAVVRSEVWTHIALTITDEDDGRATLAIFSEYRVDKLAAHRFGSVPRATSTTDLRISVGGCEDPIGAHEVASTTAKAAQGAQPGEDPREIANHALEVADWYSFAVVLPPQQVNLLASSVMMYGDGRKPVSVDIDMQ